MITLTYEQFEFHMQTIHEAMVYILQFSWSLLAVLVSSEVESSTRAVTYEILTALDLFEILTEVNQLIVDYLWVADLSCGLDHNK